MPCPHCQSAETTKRSGPTSLGWARFVCKACRHRFNERTSTLFNDLQYPTDIVQRRPLAPPLQAQPA